MAHSWLRDTPTANQFREGLALLRSACEANDGSLTLHDLIEAVPWACSAAQLDREKIERRYTSVSDAARRALGELEEALGVEVGDLWSDVMEELGELASQQERHRCAPRNVAGVGSAAVRLDTRDPSATLRGVLGRFRMGLYVALALGCGACVREPPRSSRAAPAQAGSPAVFVPPLTADAGRAPAAFVAAPEFQATASGEYVLSFGAAKLRVSVEGDRYDVGVNRVLAWVLGAARAVEGYYGAFPVPEARLFVHATHGNGVQGGHTEPGPVPRIDIEVGQHASAWELQRNWSLAHEFVHLALPDLARQHHWLEEGIASYVEPLARVRAGQLDEKDVWREWLENLHLGLPEQGDRGLDHTPTWGRTYWGGALYCFLADLELRKRSHGQSELRDALRGILSAGGNIRVDWPIARVLGAGDAATQTDVLQQLYARMKDQPVPFDLPQIWRELGVSEQGGAIVYDDLAPLAKLRKSFLRGG